MITRIKNGKIILSNEIVENQYLYFEENKITNITNEELAYDEEIDANGQYVSPGFIDMHVHGGGGYDFMDGGEDAIINTAKFHLKHGTTSILATTLACSTEVLVNFPTSSSPWLMTSRWRCMPTATFTACGRPS